MFNVYFVVDEESGEKDFLKGFDSQVEAEEYRADQIEKEGWDDGFHESYAALYIIEQGEQNV